MRGIWIRRLPRPRMARRARRRSARSGSRTGSCADNNKPGGYPSRGGPHRAREELMRFCQIGLAIAAAVAFAAVIGGVAQADYPEKGRPITVIVPYAPGGATDTGARLMAAALEPLLHANFQVVNRPGAGSQVALTQL